MWSEVHFQRAPAKNCAARFCGKRSCYGAMLQVAARRLALSEMNSDAVSYTYAAKGAHNVERAIPKQLNGASKTTLLRQRTTFVAMPPQ